MTEKIVCKRCGRALTNDESRERFYGPVCWEKEGRVVAMAQLELEVEQVDELASLRREVAELRAMVHNMKTAPRAPTHGTIPMATHDGGTIALMVGGWDPSELATNPLFLKMQGIVGA